MRLLLDKEGLEISQTKEKEARSPGKMVPYGVKYPAYKVIVKVKENNWGNNCPCTGGECPCMVGDEYEITGLRVTKGDICCTTAFEAIWKLIFSMRCGVVFPFTQDYDEPWLIHATCTQASLHREGVYPTVFEVRRGKLIEKGPENIEDYKAYLYRRTLEVERVLR